MRPIATTLPFTRGSSNSKAAVFYNNEADLARVFTILILAIFHIYDMTVATSGSPDHLYSPSNKSTELSRDAAEVRTTTP